MRMFKVKQFFKNKFLGEDTYRVQSTQDACNNNL